MAEDNMSDRRVPRVPPYPDRNSLTTTVDAPPTFLRRNGDQAPISPKASIHFDPNAILNELHTLLSSPPQTPKVGAEAARYMASVTETVATDIEKLAQEHVDRALALQSESNKFAASVREAGALLRQRIEREASQGFQLSKIMTSARQLLDAS